jgi:endogenous inhibitor of DNA gyrase (YacG/DUF329 family)
MKEYTDKKVLIAIFEKIAKEDENNYFHLDELTQEIFDAPAADVVERKRGEWVLEAHKENSNYGWNVTAECPECHDEKKVVWRGLFPNFCDALAKETALDNAKSVKLSNFCPNCGADMRGAEDGK